MTICTFSEFYSACVDKLENYQLRALNPNAVYFKLHTGYCGLVLEPERTWISIFVGGMRDVWDLRRVLEKMPLVGFRCRENGPVYVLARYYGAHTQVTDEKYENGARVLFCTINPLQTLRLKKSKEKIAA